MTPALAALAMGTLGSAHCAAMCGGIAGALSASGPTAAPPAARVLVQNGARIASYAVAGAVAGGMGSVAAGAGGAEGIFVLRTIAALVTVAAGLQIGGWSALLRYVEDAGAVLWRRVAPLAARARRERSLAGAVLFGALWGWLPCGLVYSALVVAATSGSALAGAATMAAFGVGTAPATVTLGLVAGRGFSFLKAASARRIAGALVVAFGVWTFGAAASAYRSAVEAGTPACHGAAAATP